GPPTFSPTRGLLRRCQIPSRRRGAQRLLRRGSSRASFRWFVVRRARRAHRSREARRNRPRPWTCGSDNDFISGLTILELLRALQFEYRNRPDACGLLCVLGEAGVASRLLVVDAVA